MKVNEIFHSHQGEGASLGRPAIFVRLQGCNLAEKCPIPCDTKYSWNEGEELTHMEIMERIERFSLYWSSDTPVGRRCNRVVITGGEPLIQILQLSHLVKTLKSHNYIVEIETNGTISPSENLRNLVDMWNISPKFLTQPVIALVTSRFTNCKGEVYFKFVIDSIDDLNAIGQLTGIFDMEQIPRENIILMPQATTVADMQSRLPMIMEFAKSWNFRVTPRLQILAHGNKRGV